MYAIVLLFLGSFSCNACSFMILIIVAKFTCNTFISTMIVLTLATTFPSKVDIFFPWGHLLHLCKFWTIYHFVSIQTIDMTCRSSILLNILIMTSSLCHCYSWFLLFHFAHVYIMIISTTICVVFASLFDVVVLLIVVLIRHFGLL